MQIRQALEAAGRTCSSTPRRRGLLPELETNGQDRAAFSGVVALSYAG